MRKLKPVLPWIALVSAIVAAGLLVAGSFYRKARIVDTGETRTVVEKALEELLSRQPAALDDPDFKAAFEAFGRSPHVAMTIMVNRDGGAYVTGTVTMTSRMTVNSPAAGQLSGPGEGGRTLAELGLEAPPPPDPLEGISPDEFSADQRLLLEVKSAVESGNADHADVYGSLIRAVRNPAGGMLGAIGVRYERSFWVSTVPEAAWLALVLGFAIFLGVSWLSVPAWTFLDARDRGENAWVWTVFTLVGNVIALVAYLLARVPRTAKST
ncbi:MAG TPA: hypothetical protein VLH81_04850 [Desulfobacterales bacterium]|nr:hypothetical protein [Desulfobacterales bacterium]